MGNTVPQRMCSEAGTAVGRRPTSVTTEAAAAAAAVPAAPRRVIVTAGKQRRDEQEWEATPAGRSRGGAPRAGGGDAATVVTVKIVLKRKDAEALVARLNAQGARERKARMAELKGELRARNGYGGASPCRDAWRPRLAPIQES